MPASGRSPRRPSIQPAASPDRASRARAHNRPRLQTASAPSPDAASAGAAASGSRDASRLSWHTVRRILVRVVLVVLTVLVVLEVREVLEIRGLAAPATVQNVQYGMNTRVLDAPMADKMSELGARVVRLAYGWDVIEAPCKGCFNWETTDAWRDEAKRTHRTIYATLAYAPAWANGSHPYRYPPLNYQDWYDFVFATV